ncbi:MAG: ABC-type iron transport system FetAB ATPase subunit/GNAT superfamily N-acetyltransferase [Phycisphaerales bacterium]
MAERIACSGSPITLITGESGSGKSTLLRAVRARLAADGVPVIDGRDLRVQSRVPIVRVSEDPLDLWLRTLARAGLGEARLLARSGAQLSVGERHRLRLACCLCEAMKVPGSVVLLDEFASPLDRATAESVCRGVVRWVHSIASKSGVRLIVACAHEDLPGFLSPCEVVRCGLWGSGARVEPLRSETDTASSIRIEPGTMADYAPLSACHYLAGPPATVAGVWRAIRTTAHGERLAGVLVASYPTLNGRWRQQVWPGEYVGQSPAQKRDAAARLNRDVRCLSRVIVEPASRGLGVARRLVEHYLWAPLTRRTEAVAAMGALSPFFEHAGMRALVLPRRDADERWRTVLERAGLSPIETLTLDSPRARAAMDRPGVARGLGVWVNATADARRARAHGVSEADLLRDAACRLVAQPIAYTAEQENQGAGNE